MVHAAVAVRAAKSVLAGATLTAAVTLAPQAPPIIEADLTPSNCLIGMTRLMPAAYTVSDATTSIALACGGVGGPVGGPGIGMAKAGGKIPASVYGEPGVGKVVKTKLSSPKMKTFVENNDVPWPCKSCKMASNTDEYRVYTIWGKTENGNKTYKYGITKVGKSRPKAQLKACRDKLKVDECDWKWIRTNVSGWRNARKWEAHHAARYKAKHGKCPPGMTKCK